MEHVTFDDSSQGAFGDYQVYLLPCYATDTASRYPVVYLLHGSGHDDAYWLAVGIVGAADEAIEQGKVSPMIVVMPDGGVTFSPGRDGVTFTTFLTDELVPRVDGSFRTIAERSGRAVGGISLGGGLALSIAAKRPTLFTAVGGHSPAVFDTAPLAAKLKAGGERVWLDVGAGDSLRNGSVVLDKELRALGGDVRFEMPEGKHVESYWSAHLMEYLDFYDQSFRARG
ncbi:alpha/beta hydrolase [Ornithinimicrobium avium]|uniref:alpha/beta hydrolase n=1 Tax=Ornithinimicrobium avium TaxID=2283195 RepID=UPI0013B4650C|nr:alpha/beta hydrolase-fold protein [Ornithinimicrobium avium]